MQKFLFDLFPLILFFLAYRYADIYTATGVAIAASIAQILWLRLRKLAIEGTHWINLGVITFFGGATLLLHDDSFIRWKPTVLYWLFGGILITAQLLFDRNLMQKMLHNKITLPPQAWRGLNLSWGIFFLLAGAINLYVAFSGHFTETQWVNFKVFGLTALLIVFGIGQSIWLARHVNLTENPTNSHNANTSNLSQNELTKSNNDHTTSTQVENNTTPPSSTHNHTQSK